MAIVNLREAAARLKAVMPEGYSVVMVEARNGTGGHIQIQWRCYHEREDLRHGSWHNTFAEALASLVAKRPGADPLLTDESVEVEEPAKENTDGR